jgi:hypothetical protein
MLSSTLMNSVQFWTGSNFDECFRYACSSSRQSTLMQLLFSFDRGMRVEKTLASLSSRSYLVKLPRDSLPSLLPDEDLRSKPPSFAFVFQPVESFSIHSFPVWRPHFHLGRFSADRKFCKMWLADTNFTSEKNFEQKKFSTFDNDILGKFSVRGDFSWVEMHGP